MPDDGAPQGAWAATRDDAATCTRCDLYRDATQTVFGAGPIGAPLMLLGEQPGDQEDRQGAPFVGPAGRVLSEALRAAGIDREVVYLTNVVKHFKWKPSPRSSKVRIHQTPRASEVAACSVWWEREVELVQPGALVCLGATAAKAVLGPHVRVLRDRGRFLDRDGLPVLVTVHPSSILRGPPEDRNAAFSGLVADLRVAAAGPGA